MKRLTLLLGVALAALFAGCHRRPLVDPQSAHYLRVYIDEELKNITTGFYNPDHAHPAYRTPEIMRVLLYDASGRIASERYLRSVGRDSRGVYFDGYIQAAPGDYTLVAYNFNTESTIVGGEGSLWDAKAYTNEIPEHLRSRLSSRNSETDERIVNDADPLFVARSGVHVGNSEVAGELRTPEGDWFEARSVVEAYYVQIGIRNVSCMSSTVALLSGMAGSVALADGSVDAADEVTVYFEMIRSEVVEEDTAVVYATFGTFGKLPDKANKLRLSFDVQTTYGAKVTTELDITEQFGDPDAVDRRWLIIDGVIEVPLPPDSPGGFAPGVSDWGDIHTDIII